VRHALGIAGAVVAVGLVAYAVVSLSGDPSPAGKGAERKRGRTEVARDTDAADDASNKRTRKGDAAKQGGKREPVRGPAPVPPPQPVDENVPASYGEGRDELDKLVEKLEGMVERGEHMDQPQWVETYRRGDIVMVALMRTPEVGASTTTRSDLSKMNQRFRMAITKVAPVPAAQ